jgi:hypothetical protein
VLSFEIRFSIASRRRHGVGRAPRPNLLYEITLGVTVLFSLLVMNRKSMEKVATTFSEFPILEGEQYAPRYNLIITYQASFNLHISGRLIL